MKRSEYPSREHTGFTRDTALLRLHSKRVEIWLKLIIRSNALRFILFETRSDIGLDGSTSASVS